MWIDFLLILVFSILIGVLSHFMTPIAEQIEDAYNWPSSVKGAVVDAISSSFPEFATALAAVIFFNRVEVGLNTIVGSALFNLLLIPGICALFLKIKVAYLDPMGFRRDSVFYFVATVLLGLFIYLFEGINLWISIFFLLLYIVYLWFITKHVESHRAQLAEEALTNGAPASESKASDVNKLALWLKIAFFTFLIGGVCHALVGSALTFGEQAGLSSAFIGFFILAAATSIPDMMLSIVSTRRGKFDASISNVFASNIFDICICIFLPILIYFISNKKYSLDIENESLLSVLILIVCGFLSIFAFGYRKPRLTKLRGVVMIGIYFVALSVIYNL